MSGLDSLFDFIDCRRNVFVSSNMITGLQFGNGLTHYRKRPDTMASLIMKRLFEGSLGALQVINWIGRGLRSMQCIRRIVQMLLGCSHSRGA